MSWKKFETGTRAGSSKEFISISTNKFNFSRAFVETAQIQNAKAVKIFSDSENNKIGFEFLDEKDPDSLALAEVRHTLNCCSIGVISQFPWLKKYTQLPASQRRYKSSREDNLWTIDLSENEVEKSE